MITYHHYHHHKSGANEVSVEKRGEGIDIVNASFLGFMKRVKKT